MNRLWSTLILLGMLALLFLPELAMAAGGGKIENIVIVSDTRKLTGLLAWWGGLYNESHTYFTALTVALIPSIGVVFGVVADIIMSHIGIDLHSRDLAEH